MTIGRNRHGENYYYYYYLLLLLLFCHMIVKLKITFHVSVLLF